MKLIKHFLVSVTLSLTLFGCAASSTSPDGVNCSPKTAWQDENPDCVGR